MRQSVTICSVPLWPLVRNTFVISLVLLTLVSLILGFLWFGLMQQFSQTFADPDFQWQMDGFQNISGIFVIFFAIFNGIFGSIILTMLVGLGGLVYNVVNSKGGGIELEISDVRSEHRSSVHQSSLPGDSIQPAASGDAGSGKSSQQRESHDDTV